MYVPTTFIPFRRHSTLYQSEFIKLRISKILTATYNIFVKNSGPVLNVSAFFIIDPDKRHLIHTARINFKIVYEINYINKLEPVISCGLASSVPTDSKDDSSTELLPSSTPSSITYQSFTTRESFWGTCNLYN